MVRPRRHVATVLRLLVLLATSSISQGAENSSSDRPEKLRLEVPSYFVANVGQKDPAVRYYVEGRGRAAYLTTDGLILRLVPESDQIASLGDRLPHDTAAATSIHLRFVGASRTPRISGEERVAGRFNFYIGRDPARWQRDVPAYRHVTYHDLWPSVDATFTGESDRIKYAFAVRPGGRVSDVTLRLEGARSVVADAAGHLVIATDAGTLLDEKPTAFQEIGGRRIPVTVSYGEVARDGEAYRYGFVVGQYDRHKPLIIDPGITYSTFIRGAWHDDGEDIAVDQDGDMYIVGTTLSSNFPIPCDDDPLTEGLQNLKCDVTRYGQCGKHSTDKDRCQWPDVFVVKLSPNGFRRADLVYATIIGGGTQLGHPIEPEEGRAIAVEAQTGRAYVVGRTHSTDFPTTPDAYQTENRTTIDCNCSTSGVHLQASEESTCHDFFDAFLVVLDPGGELKYGTYLGGTAEEEAFDVAIGADGIAYVTGWTCSEDLDTSPGALEPKDPLKTKSDGGFVFKIDPAGLTPATQRLYATYLGQGTGAFDSAGAKMGAARGIAVDGVGDVYVTGDTGVAGTFSSITGNSAFQSAKNAGSSASKTDAYVVRIAPVGNGTADLVYGTFFGLGGSESGEAVQVRWETDRYMTYVGGWTSSKCLPTPTGADCTGDGDLLTDGFVAKFDTGSSGSGSLVYSANVAVPGSSVLSIRDIAVTSQGEAVVTGNVQGPGLPVVGDPCLSGPAGKGDAFAVQLDSAGTEIIYGGYFGGAGTVDVGNGISLDATDRVYIAGTSDAGGGAVSLLPTTAGAFDSPSATAYRDAFAAKLDILASGVACPAPTPTPTTTPRPTSIPSPTPTKLLGLP